MNTKRFFALFLLLATSASFVKAAELKKNPEASLAVKQAVYLDIEKVIIDAKPLKELRDNLEITMKKKADPMEKLNKDMEEKAKKMQGDAVKDEAKTKLQEELQALAQKRMSMMNALQAEMQKLQEDFGETVTKKIVAVGNKLGWGLILFKGQAIVVDQSLDKTTILINELNKEHEAAKAKSKN
ncbi:OmpH family outer membrane protein [Candidatus Babeliales bacterium]|nr:OmpH family outer membrane protein [Candidatus Babeliales bacterium]